MSIRIAVIVGILLTMFYESFSLQTCFTKDADTGLGQYEQCSSSLPNCCKADGYEYCCDEQSTKSGTGWRNKVLIYTSVNSILVLLTICGIGIYFYFKKPVKELHVGLQPFPAPIINRPQTDIPTVSHTILYPSLERPRIGYGPRFVPITKY